MRARHALLKAITWMCMVAATVATVAQAQPDKPRPKRRRPLRAQVKNVPDGVRAYRDIEYARPDGTPLLLDLYVPQEAGRPLPLVVWIHGGAWRAGSKQRCPALRLTERGYVVASINYRLSQQAVFPAQIEDCKAAIRWLRANAAKYHIDRERVGVWGSSAGGHLVALLGTSGDVRELEGEVGDNLDQTSRVEAVCDFFGPTDFLQMDAHMLEGSRLVHNAPDSPESQLVGGPIQENKDKVARADPITYVTKDDPPFLIMHGDRDPLVPLHQSELLHSALVKAEVDVAFHVVKGAGHGFGGPEISRRVAEFFDKHLRRKATGQTPSARGVPGPPPGGTRAQFLIHRIKAYDKNGDGKVSRDEETGSQWNRMAGVATSGPLEGKQLDHRVGIMSFTRKWRDLHPESTEVTSPAKD